MKGFNIAEQAHVVRLEPVDVGGVAKTLYWSMANHRHASIIIVSGVAANQAVITVFNATSNAGAGEHAIAFTSYNYGTTDVAGPLVATGAGGFTQTAAGCLTILEIDASELTQDHPYIGVKTDTAAANLISIVAVLSGARYEAQLSPTVNAA